MMEQSARMKQLIDDLLLLSNVESSLIKNRSEKINSKKLFEKIKKNIKLVDKGKHKIIYKIIIHNVIVCMLYYHIFNFNIFNSFNLTLIYLIALI